MKKITGKVLAVIDFAACLIACLTIFWFVVAGLIAALVGIVKEFHKLWSNGTDRIVFMVLIFSVLWCVLRWKKLT
jgi:hypothetical protein